MRKPKKYDMFYFKDKNGEIQFRKPTPRKTDIHQRRTRGEDW